MLDAVNKPQDRMRSLGRLFTFLWLVVRGFMRNQGLLLSGALAYYTLLSIVPMSILFLVGLSNFIAEEQLLHTLSTYTGMVIPGYSAILAEQVQIFLQHRQAIGIIGFLTMLFFSSMAFAVLQSALSVIFFHPVRITPRNFILSAVIPYAYVFSIALGIVLFSLIAIAFQTLGKSELTLFGMSVNLEATSRIALYTLGVICEVALLSSIYLIMPAVRTTFRHALIGGITAAILWEVIRHALIWYYSALSMVNIIYGSFATAVVALLVTEAAALILLLGAQVIAELERKSHESTEESKPIRKGVTAMKRIRMSVGCFVLITLVAFLGASASTANCESTGEYIDDSVITTKVKSLLASDDFIKSFQISVETYKGTVQMTGVVDSQRAIDKAGEIARSVAGVKSVKNDLLMK